MKSKYFVLLALLISKLIFSQEFINQELISYKGLNFYSSKKEIIETLGKPKNYFNPNYECGFLSGDYLTLDYGRIKFTGNKEENYLIEQIDLENDNTVKIKYGKYTLTNKTTLKELIKIFGKRIENKMNNTNAIPFGEQSDDALFIEVKNGKLIQIRYWSPC